jgi:hypothetical protein
MHRKLVYEKFELPSLPIRAGRSINKEQEKKNRND